MGFLSITLALQWYKINRRILSNSMKKDKNILVVMPVKDEHKNNILKAINLYTVHTIM